MGFLLGHGGDALQMLTLAKGVQASGARVNVIVPELETTIGFAQRCADADLACERTPLITSSMQGTRQQLLSVVKLFRRLDARVVHFHTGNSCLPRSVMIALTLVRARRAIVTIQSPYETIEPDSRRARVWAALAARRMHAVVSPSTHGAEFQKRCGVPEELIVTVRNAVDVDVMASGDASVVRRQLAIADDVPLVLFCSRLDPQKRPVEAVRAFEIAATDYPDAILVFVGDGEERNAVEREVEARGLSERVRLVGYQSNVPDWLAAATVWLLPTERENFSVALLEAFAAGCPVVTTDCRGNDEVVKDGENCLVFGVGDIEEAGRRLRELLADADLRRELSAAARSTASNYTAARVVSEYQAVYDSYDSRE